MCLALPGSVSLGSEERVSVTEDTGKKMSDLANCPMSEGRGAAPCNMQGKAPW